MTRRSFLLAGVAAGAIVVLTSSSARSDDPVTSAVRFNREIIRIFERKCLSCHAPDGIAMSLATYREVRPWSRAIREEIVEQRMPPASAAPGYVRLKDDIALTPRELSTILTWLDGGLPRGDESDLPVRPKAVAQPEPDHRVAVPAQQIPGDWQDVVRRATVDLGAAEDRWVRQIQFRPGDRRLLRAAFVSIVGPDGSQVWAGSWTPWLTDVAPAAPAAVFVPRGARLAVELHYRGLEVPAVDTSSVALSYAADGQWRPLSTLALVPARRQSGTGARSERTFSRNVAVWGIRVDPTVDGQSVEVTARRPDGSIEVLLWVPKTRADWPAPFIFRDPIPLPAGTVVSVTMSGTAPRAGTRTLLTFHHTG